MKSLRTLIVACSVFAVAQACLAAPTPFSGELTAGDPVFNRPLVGNPPSGLSGVGTAVSYDVFAFTVTAIDTYVMETLSASLAPAGFANDTFIALYQNVFNPASPLTNALEANDDISGSNFLSRISRSLNPGTNYFLVVTSFSNGAFGSYTGQFDSTTGAGRVVLNGTAPEPASLALLGLGLAGLAASRRRKSQ